MIRPSLPHKEQSELIKTRELPFAYAVLSITVLGNIAVGLISIYLPLHAYNLGANVLLVGLIGGAYSISYLIASLFVGLISDKIGLVRSLIFGLLVVSFQAQ